MGESESGIEGGIVGGCDRRRRKDIDDVGDVSKLEFLNGGGRSDELCFVELLNLLCVLALAILSVPSCPVTARAELSSATTFSLDTSFLLRPLV